MFAIFRLLHEWICKPSNQKDVITQRQQAIVELVDKFEVSTKIQTKLRTICDLERLLSKLVKL